MRGVKPTEVPPQLAPSADVGEPIFRTNHAARRHPMPSMRSPVTCVHPSPWDSAGGLYQSIFTEFWRTGLLAAGEMRSHSIHDKPIVADKDSRAEEMKRSSPQMIV